MSSGAEQIGRDDDPIRRAQRQCEAARAVLREWAALTRSSHGPMLPLDFRVARHSGTPRLSGDSITGYALLGERHRGGQGIVYEAIQQATKRHVAIKMLFENPHVSAATQRMRFEREVEILSHIRHPNVVTVHDSGVAEGCLFYVMDLVQGDRLDEWVASHRTGSDGSRTGRAVFGPLLRMFVKICDAVNAAHLRGVIHRDLKPGNILIDAAGEPRVLDFGLAKFTAGSTDVTEVVSMTAPGQFVGSLPWSSPEQAAGEVDQIDTRSDVYAIGVLLYQSLTGCFPYRVNGNVVEVVQQIRSAEPAPMKRPLWPAGPLGDLDRLAGWVRRIDDELETIVRRCLQKDPQRRYQTAGDIGRDLERYLNQEPIEAKRDSVAYMLRKQLRRHRVPVAAIAAVLVASVAGLGASLYYWRQAEIQRVEADRRRGLAEAATQILKGMFGELGDRGFQGQDVTVAQMLNSFSEEALEKASGQPELELELASTLADAYLSLGIAEKAEPHVQRVVELTGSLLGEACPEYGAALNMRATLRQLRAEYDTAEADYRAALTVCAAGDVHNAVIRGRAQYGLAHLLEQTGRLDEAVSFIQAASATFRGMADRRGMYGTCLRSWASFLATMGRFDEAGPLHEEATAILIEEWGEDHPSVAVAWNDHAEMLRLNDRPQDAIPLYEKALAVFQRAYGEDSPKTAACMGSLGVACRYVGQLERAGPLLKDSLAIRRRVCPEGHPDIATGANNLAAYHEAVGEFEAAAPLYREALAMLEPHLDSRHPHVVAVKANLAKVLVARNKPGDPAEAERLLTQVIAIRRQQLPPGHPEIGSSLALLGSAQLRQKRWAEAEPILREALNIRIQGMPPGSWPIASARVLLGDALMGLGRMDEAREQLLQGYEGLKASPGAPPQRLRDVCEVLIRFYEVSGDVAEQKKWTQTLESLK